MPDKKAEHGVYNPYELDNASQGQHLSQAAGSKWPALECSQWKPTEIGLLPNLSWKNYGSQQLDFVRGCDGDSNLPFNQGYRKLIPAAENSSCLITNGLLNKNDVYVGSHNFQSKWTLPGASCESTLYDQQTLTPRSIFSLKSQQEYESADSPTLTTNSERSEITDISSDLHFLKGKQQLVREQQLCTPQPHPMQQPGYNDMQLLQQHMMFKQLQELQRQQQLQQLGEVRQPSSLNQLASIGKQVAGPHFSTFINGTPVQEASQMLRNWMQQGVSPLVQGLSNKVVFPQEQCHTPRSMGMAPQQLDVSLYGTPICGTRTNLSPSPHLQVASCDSVSLAGGQSPKSTMQSPSFVNSCAGDESIISSDIADLPQRLLTAKQGFQEKCNFREVSVQDLNGGAFPGNFQGHTLQSKISLKEFNLRQEEASLPTVQQTNKEAGPSQGLVPLDPMEAKILYNMDDGNIWDAFGCRPEIGIGGFGSAMENPDSSSAFPSIQSGSWSALMQSAVAEVSSSNTGFQEWSGLTLQNTEQSTGNQISNFVKSEKQQKGWVDSNLQGSFSFSSKTLPMITDSKMISGFPGFVQPSIHLSIEQRDNMCQSGSHESIENGNPQLKPSAEGAQMVHPWAGQMFKHLGSDGQNQKVDSSDVSVDNKGHRSMQRTQQEISSASHSAHISYKGTNETFESQQSYQKEKSNDCYASKTLSAHEQGHFKRFNYFGNSSSSKGSLPDFEENSHASEEIPSKGNHGSDTFHGSVLPNGPNGIAPMRVDQSKDESTITPFGSMESSPLVKMPGADSRDASIAQLYVQASASQGFGLRLSAPSQRLANTDNFLSPQCLPQHFSKPNSSQMDPELLEKSQTWLGPPSPFPSLPSSEELPQRAYGVNKPGTFERMGFSSHLNVQGSSVTSFPLNPPKTRSQHQTHTMCNEPLLYQSMQPALPAAAGRHPPSNQSCSQDTLQQMCAKPVGQQYPVLDTLYVSPPFIASGMSQRGENMGKSYNVWRNVPSPQQSAVVEPFKSPSTSPSSMDPSNSMTTTSWAQHVPNDQNSVKGVRNPLEFGAYPSSQSPGHGAQDLGKEVSLQQITSEVVDRFQAGGVFQSQERVSDATVLASGSSLSHSQHGDLDRARHGDNSTSATGKRKLDAFVHSHDHSQNYFFLNQVQAMNSAVNSVLEVPHTTASSEQLLASTTSEFIQSMDSGPNSASQPNQFPSWDGNILSFSGEARDSPIVKASSQPAASVRHPHDIVTFGHGNHQTQPSISKVASTHTNYGLADANISPFWLKQYASFRNGQMVQILDAGPAKTVASQVPLGKPSQDLHIHASSEKRSTDDVGRGSRVRPSPTTSSAAHQQLSVPYILTSEDPNQMPTMAPKKRKITINELLPWHKEVMQYCKRLETIGNSELDWAQATNRLIEKVEDAAETIEVQLTPRPKRRLIFTMQLMQQLFRPAPASFFSADCTTNYDLILYFVSRLSLGDACSLAYTKRNDLPVPIHYNSMNSESMKDSETIDQKNLEAMKKLIERGKQLENDFQRLNKAASVVDLRVELQELERFAVINRFAKFHVRGQTDTPGTSSSGTPKPILQRYITAFMMPRNLPEGAHCLSL